MSEDKCLAVITRSRLQTKYRCKHFKVTEEVDAIRFANQRRLDGYEVIVDRDQPLSGFVGHEFVCL